MTDIDLLSSETFLGARSYRSRASVQPDLLSMRVNEHETDRANIIISHVHMCTFEHGLKGL